MKIFNGILRNQTRMRKGRSLMRCKARHGSNTGIYTASTKRDSSLRLRFPAVAVQALLVLVALQFPVTGHCDSGSGWFKNLFESKGKNMKEVATKVATLHEDNEIWGLDFSPDGKHLAATSPNTKKVHVWDWRNGKRTAQSLEKEGSDLTTTEPLRYSPDGRLLVWCGGTIARIWNTDTWEVVHTIDGTAGVEAAGGGCNAIGFTPDGKSLILVLYRVPNHPGDNLIIYSTSTWQSVWGLRTVPFQPNSLVVSPDGKFVALGGQVLSGFDKPNPIQIDIVDMTQRAIVRTIQNKGGRIAWSPDGAYIASGWGGGVEIFDAHSGEKVAEEKTGGGHPFVRYTPDGKYLISGSEGTDAIIKIWDARHHTLLQVIPGEARGLAVSPDGHYLAIGGFRDIQVWELK